MRVLTVGGLLLLVSGLVLTAGAGEGSEQGVYQYVVQQATVAFDQVPDLIADGLTGRGFQLLGRIGAGVQGECTYRALVLTAFDPIYARALLSANRLTGPFAAVDRIAVFEDERGVHVAIVNPASINRTILMDDEAHAQMTEAHRRKLREAISAAVPGSASEQQYGQMRDKGQSDRGCRAA